jgi:hypothetical protein
LNLKHFQCQAEEIRCLAAAAVNTPERSEIHRKIDKSSGTHSKATFFPEGRFIYFRSSNFFNDCLQSHDQYVLVNQNSLP